MIRAYPLGGIEIPSAYLRDFAYVGGRSDIQKTIECWFPHEVRVRNVVRSRIRACFSLITNGLWWKGIGVWDAHYKEFVLCVNWLKKRGFDMSYWEQAFGYDGVEPLVINAIAINAMAYP